MPKKRRWRGATISLLVLMIVIFGSILGAWVAATTIFQPVSSAGSGKTVQIVVQHGETSSQVADDLQTKGLIRNALTFRLLARVKGLDAHLQAGTYSFNSTMAANDIMDQLLSGHRTFVFPVTVFPGMRIEQIGAQFAGVDLPKFDEQEFLTYTKHPDQFPDAGKYPILKTLPQGNNMEGLLFPDTYKVPPKSTARDVVNMLLTEFTNAVQNNHLETQAQIHNLSLYQMVILASLVQREVQFDADSPGVAGVYWNRIHRPNAETVGQLNSDPSVEYARDLQPGTKRYWAALNDVGGNIAPDSPWNTYTHKGWPPSPICSPSLASLQAATSPKMSDYYYFLGTKDGHIVYAKTNAEFQQDVKKYLS